MVSVRPGNGHAQDPHRGAASRSVITSARAGASDDLARRQKRYFIAMAFRVACMVAMIFVGGWVRWALLGAAVLLPYIAVVIANQADHRTPATVEPTSPGAPSPVPELSISESDIIRGETIPDDGAEHPDQDLADDDDDRDGPAVAGAA